MGLIKALLRVNPEERFSAEQALQHSWFSICSPVIPGPELNLGSLINYTRLDKMQRLVLAYIASRTSDVEIARLASHFLEMDASHTGSLSKEDMNKLLVAVKKDVPDGLDLFSAIDINQSQRVEYLGMSSCGTDW